MPFPPDYSRSGARHQQETGKKPARLLVRLLKGREPRYRRVSPPSCSGAVSSSLRPRLVSRSDPCLSRSVPRRHPCRFLRLARRPPRAARALSRSGCAGRAAGRGSRCAAGSAPRGSGSSPRSETSRGGGRGDIGVNRALRVLLRLKSRRELFYFPAEGRGVSQILLEPKHTSDEGRFIPAKISRHPSDRDPADGSAQVCRDMSRA